MLYMYFCLSSSWQFLCWADDNFEKSVEQLRFEQLHFEQETPSWTTPSEKLKIIKYLKRLFWICIILFQFTKMIKKSHWNKATVKEISDCCLSPCTSISYSNISIVIEYFFSSSERMEETRKLDAGKKEKRVKESRSKKKGKIIKNN